MNKLSITLLMIMTCLLTALAANRGPNIEFSSKTHDFGTVYEKKGRVTAEFEFTNTGTKPLVIINAYATCGCTRPTFTEEPIQPGEKGKISVTYNPAGRRGEFVSTVTVTTNDKSHKKIKLKLRGVIVP